MSSDAEPLASGTRVVIRGENWVVASRTLHADCVSLKVIGFGRSNARRPRTFLLPFDRPRSLDRAPRILAVPRKRYLHGLRRLWTGTHPFGGLRTIAGARIALLPFQLEPALAVLRHGRLRVLIADEVGLGKTVQAAVLLNELAIANDGFRALVICPAGLREQWRAELSNRFSLPSTTADALWLGRTARDLPPDVNPWSLPGTYISSLDFVKQREVLRALEDVRWDVLVIDEVHTASPGTERLAAAQALGQRSGRVLLLTATPPDGDPAHLDAIARIGRLAHEPLTMFRRSREDAGLPSPRKTVMMPVRLSADERRMHRLLERYTRLLWHEATGRHDPKGCLAAVLLRKRALSGATALALSLRRRIALLGSAALPLEEQLVLPLGDDEPLTDTTPDDVVGAPGLADRGRERTLLERLAAAAERAGHAESKLAFLRRLLARLDEPVVVFTEYRDMLAHLAGTLAVHDPVLLHGGMTAAERVNAQRVFTSGGKLLLATDAASEGLNLHHRCRTVVHFELPWMPMRLEQRTGRVNRLGQTRRVHEILLVAHHTCERLVLTPLLARIRAAGARSRLASLTEAAVAAAVLRDEPLPSAPWAAPIGTAEMSLADEAGAEKDRIDSHRRLGGAGASAPSGAPRDLLLHVDGAGPSATLLVHLALEHGNGAILHEDLVALRCVVDGRCGARGPQDARRLAVELVERVGSEVIDMALAAKAADLAVARTRATALLDRLAAREADIAAAAGGSVHPVQAGLFDRRAVAEAEARARSATALRAEAEARAAALSSPAVRSIARIAAVHIGRPFPT